MSKRDKQIRDIIDSWDVGEDMAWFDYHDGLDFAEAMNKIILHSKDKAAAFIDRMERFKYEAAEYIWEARAEQGYYKDVEDADNADNERTAWLERKLERFDDHVRAALEDEARAM